MLKKRCAARYRAIATRSLSLLLASKRDAKHRRDDGVDCVAVDTLSLKHFSDMHGSKNSEVVHAAPFHAFTRKRELKSMKKRRSQADPNIVYGVRPY